MKKLGWFRKKIAGLGKRIYFRKAKKVNLFSINSMVRSLIRIYAEINNGDYEQGLRDFCSQVEDESKNLIAEMIETPITLGISLKSVLSQDIEDLAFIAALIFWAVMGSDYKEVWSEPELFYEDDGVVRLVMQQSNCLFCAEEHELTQKDFGSFSFGEILASIFKGVIQALEDFVGNQYDVTARETKCFMRGDPYGEITMWLKPRE